MPYYTHTGNVVKLSGMAQCKVMSFYFICWVADWEHAFMWKVVRHTWLFKIIMHELRM